MNDEDDAFPTDPSETEDTDGDGTGDNADNDDDNDGYTDEQEEAAGTDPKDPASVPTDSDGDGDPDATDPDDDNDGVNDEDDAFPTDPSETEDTDGDGTGDNADNDDDNDGVNDEDDAFPTDPSESEDTDGDGIGDNADNDDDNDGYTDEQEENAGSDPRDPSSVPTDSDGDGDPDATDPDDDNDGVNDEDDAFPTDPNESEDTDGDGIGNNGDDDDDGDGYSDDVEESVGSDPQDPNDTPVDTDGDGVPDVMDDDDDNDGVRDEDDAFPTDSGESVDTDGDGIGNNADPDDDNDGFTDEEEIDAGSDPLDPDSVPVQQAPGNDGPRASIKTSTGNGSITFVWALMGMLLIRRKHLAVAVAALLVPVAHLSAAEPKSQERLYFVGSGEYSRFAPETSGVKVTDSHDWGWSLGLGYDLSETLAMEGKYYHNGSLTYELDGDEAEVKYSGTTLKLRFYPQWFGGNERHEDDWPVGRLNWYIAGGVSSTFTEADTSGIVERENSINMTYGGGVTYGLTSKTQVYGSLNRVSGDVMAMGVGLIWYPFRQYIAPKRQLFIEEANIVEPVPVPVPEVVEPEPEPVVDYNCAAQHRARSYVLFASDSSEVYEEYTDGLKKTAEEFDNCDSSVITLIGYTDSRGDEAYNRKLSYRRVTAIEEYLLDQGVPLNRIVKVARGIDESQALMPFEKRRVEVYLGNQSHVDDIIFGND